jgi:ParB-like chromosome segregation protein Spo0J
MLDKLISPAPTLPPDPTKLRPHPTANEFPMMDGPEYEGLKASIKERGFLESEPIWLYGDPLMILDGRNRQRAANELGLVLTAKHYRVFTGTYDEAEAFSNAKNGHRRHLTNAQKEERVKAYIAKHPNATSRAVARACGVSHNTVEKYKNPPGEAEFKRFKSAWEDLSDDHRARFVKACATDLRALL